MKSGIKTSEFWLTLLSLIGGVLVGSGVLTEDESLTLQEAVVALALAVAPIWQYIRSRTAIKVADSGK